LEPVVKDAAYERLEEFRGGHVFVGPHNRPDVEAGFAQLDFAPPARPVGDEGIAENAHQLAALCRAQGINHLVYVGFAINWCLLMSPGGMVDMRRYGVMCSTLREAVTAVENRETAREEREKQQALWRVSLEFGFVFGVDDFIRAVGAARPAPSR
jgi:nicotinamidase-related amidase